MAKDDTEVKRTPSETQLDELLTAAHKTLGIAVQDRLAAQGGPPELRDPDLALDRLLASTRRQTGNVVASRLDLTERRRPTDSTAHRLASSCVPEETDTLRHRPAAMRMKYRREVLSRVQAFWPHGLEEALHCAQDRMDDLVELLHREGGLTPAQRLLQEARTAIGEVLRLPAPTRRLVAPAGADYLEAVEEHLAAPASELVHSVRSLRRFMQQELGPCLREEEGADTPGAVEIAQDVSDDLDRARARATALARAVADVEQASNDFCGADLRAAHLEGVLLEGVHWDSSTAWPADWEDRVRQMSTLTDEGQRLLVVGVNPYDRAVPTDV